MNYSFKPDDVVVTSWSSAEASECFFRGVMVTHKETGIIVTSEKSFSQHENRHLAFLELEEKLKLIGDENE
jgi:hypothetical protein